MTIHEDITDIILGNFGPHFHFWQLKNSRLENIINDYYTNLTSKTILYQINAHIKLIEMYARIFIKL